MRRGRRVVVDQRRAVARGRAGMPAAQAEDLRRMPRAEVPDQRRRRHDGRERGVEGEDGNEGCSRDAPHPAVLQRPRADAVRGVQHQRRHGRLDAVEDAGHPRHVAEAQVDPAQGDQDEQRGQHEQRAGDDAAPGAVHQPADVGGQLLRLGAGQQHAVVQRVQEALLADPAAALDQFAVHDGDLPGRAAEADEPQLQPEAQRLAEAHGFGRPAGVGDGRRSGCHFGSPRSVRVAASGAACNASNTADAAATSSSSSACSSRRPASTLSRPAASATGMPPASR